MATPVDEPERPDGYYYQPGYQPEGSHGSQPGGYQEAIEMQPYPQEPPPDYVPGSGQPAPISTRGARPPPAGIAPPSLEPMPEASDHPIEVTCRHCGNHVTTRCNYKVGSAARRAACYMLIGCCIPCACIPLCKQSMKDVEHYCPDCKQHLGTYIKPNEVRLRPGDKVRR